MIGDDKHRSIGTVISVSADKMTVELHRRTDNFVIVGFDDMQYVAQLGSYILIPVQTEYAVYEIVNLTEKDPGTISIREDTKDMGKAMSAKYLEVVPVGSLTREKKLKDSRKFNFGISTFPSLYADALYATSHELDIIFKADNSEEGDESKTRWTSLQVGRSNIFGGYNVKVDIDAFFGGHAAVLGNTGSGKSCTVASILQSLFSKENDHKATGATFLIFDVNGEYSKALTNERLLKGAKVTKLKLDGTAKKDCFTLPHWFLSQEEWELLLRASERAQKPVLRTALGLTSLMASKNVEDISKLKQHFVSKCIIAIFATSESPVGQMRRVINLLKKFGTDDLNSKILNTYNYDSQYANFPDGGQDEFLEKIRGFINEDIDLPNYKNKFFNFDDLEDCLDLAILYEEAHGNKQIRDYCSSLITRTKELQKRADFSFLRESEDQILYKEKLSNILGLEVKEKIMKKQSQIIILDMNNVGDEVVELVSAVLSRMIFELLKKQTDRNKFPVHLVLEEAHRYISQKPSQYAIDATQIFERIAKEGRKYGMFLILASQRPSDLSKTVLSQCINFIVHRIQNPDDLAHIRQMTPFISKNVLEKLPSLPKQNALIFGNAVTIPVTFKVRDANPLPESDDAKISQIWFRELDEEVSSIFED